jgi:hypothetical protein
LATLGGDYPVATLSTIDPTLPDGHRGGKLETNCLSYSTCSIIIKSGSVQMQIYYKAVDLHNIHWYKYSSCAPSTFIHFELGVSVN